VRQCWCRRNFAVVELEGYDTKLAFNGVDRNSHCQPKRFILYLPLSSEVAVAGTRPSVLWYRQIIPSEVSAACF
jgi:hypothetical protein